MWKVQICNRKIVRVIEGKQPFECTCLLKFHRTVIYLNRRIQKVSGSSHSSSSMTKPTKWPVHRAKTRSARASADFAVCFMDSWGSKLIPASGQRRLWSAWASLIRCPSWSESSLGSRHFVSCHAQAQYFSLGDEVITQIVIKFLTWPCKKGTYQSWIAKA